MDFRARHHNYGEGGLNREKHTAYLVFVVMDRVPISMTLLVVPHIYRPRPPGVRAECFDRCIGYTPVEVVERPREILAEGCSHAAIVLYDELNQEVAHLGVQRLAGLVRASPKS